MATTTKSAASKKTAARITGYTLTFGFDRETKNKRVYKEIPPPKGARREVVGSLYVSKESAEELNDPDTLQVVITPVTRSGAKIAAAEETDEEADSDQE